VLNYVFLIRKNWGRDFRAEVFPSFIDMRKEDFFLKEVGAGVGSSRTLGMMKLGILHGNLVGNNKF